MIEVDCGKEEFCRGCPFERGYPLERAQELGKMATVFAGSIPSDEQILRLADLTKVNVTEIDKINIRNAAVKMGLNHCRIEEI